jgi:hypothetical protein
MAENHEFEYLQEVRDECMEFQNREEQIDFLEISKHG